MGAIVDTLHFGPEEISLLIDEYPDAVITNLTNSHQVFQQYRVIIPSKNWYEDSYYVFLLDNGIAMSSSTFCSRIESDPKFVTRMRAKVVGTKERLASELD